MINSTSSIVFRESQSLHSSSVDLQRVNVTFGDIQINSSACFIKFDILNHTLVLGSVSVYLFKQVEFWNVVIKCSNMATQYRYSTSHLLTLYQYIILVFKLCFWISSFSWNMWMLLLLQAFHWFKIILLLFLCICVYKYTIEHCTFENNYALFVTIYKYFLWLDEL